MAKRTMVLLGLVAGGMLLLAVMWNPAGYARINHETAQGEIRDEACRGFIAEAKTASQTDMAQRLCNSLKAKQR